jgi:hypothetical protein
MVVLKSWRYILEGHAGMGDPHRSLAARVRVGLYLPKLYSDRLAVWTLRLWSRWYLCEA